jgi:hypothetical protein
MVWTVKYAYEHWNEDVLLLLHLGVSESVVNIVQDPRIINKLYLRSDDRTYAEIFVSWDSKKSYDEWYAAYPEFSMHTAEVQRYMESFGISRARYDPPHEDYSWDTHPSVRPDRMQFPKNVITHADIFAPPEE